MRAVHDIIIFVFYRAASRDIYIMRVQIAGKRLGRLLAAAVNRYYTHILIYYHII